MKSILHVFFLTAAILSMLDDAKGFPTLFASSPADDNDTTAGTKSLLRRGFHSYIVRGPTHTTASAMGKDDTHDASSCPRSVPEQASKCHDFFLESRDRESACLYNYVDVPDVGGDTTAMPSVSCDCITNGRWTCSIHAEYLKAVRRTQILLAHT
jgi:hypothetical protein